MVKVAVDCHCFLGEGPVWDAKTHSICWVDILKGDIHEFNTETGLHKTTHVQQMIGAIALCTDGNFLAALKGGFGFFNRENSKITLFSNPESHLPDNRFNDGKCDPEGRFWIGSMAIDETPAAGSLYMLDINHNVVRKIESTTISNGLAWSPDHQTFYYIDTPTLTIAAYDFSIKDGQITNKRTAFHLDKKDGYPDGMTIDTEGMLWIAHWNGWQITRWDPLKGKKLFALALPVAHVTSCTFGGPHLQDLYITTAKKGLSPNELKQQPLAGNLFVWKQTSYSGIPTSEYKIISNSL